MINKVSNIFYITQERAIEAFSRAKHAEASKADELDALRMERAREREERLPQLRETCGERLTLLDLVAHTLDARIGRVERELGALAAEAEQRREALVEATSKVRAFERLDERRAGLR